MWNKKNKEALDLLNKYSEALSRHINKNPDLTNEIAWGYSKKPAKVFNKLSWNAEKAINDAVKKDDIDRCKKVLRLYKYQLLCILSAKYLAKKIDELEFCSLWSDAACKCLNLAINFGQKHLTKKLGHPTAIDNNGKRMEYKFTVIALGKLGAGELNLSSDIDLLFLYNTDRGHVGTDSSITLNEFSAKLATLITSIISKIEEDGFCFRVDIALRPEGSQGPIANSVDAAIRYYENWGTELERMMLIRARPVAGSLELGYEFTDGIKPFVYRKSLTLTGLEKIKDLKTRIQQEALKSSSEGINLKLGDGGIREVEFVVHSIQLLNGGKNKDLLTTNTFKSLETIHRAGLLPAKQAGQLLKAYKFLRHAENMVQMAKEEQTHTLPTKTADLENLAHRMGYTDNGKSSVTQQLMADYDENSSIAKFHFQHIFEIDFEKQGMEEAILSNISNSSGDEEEADSLAWFKREETKRIRYLDLENKIEPYKVSEKLCHIAEVIITEAYKIAGNGLRKTYGPSLADTKKRSISHLAILGMGKLGGREIDYASDLDLMFIYSSDGQTAGPKIISNKEYFTKLSQRIISLISMHTRYDRAYQIDTDLRPSGRSGVLVTLLDSFKTYHSVEAMLWERQALLKARPVAGDPNFCEMVRNILDDFCYKTPLPKDFKEQIGKLRMRMEKEKANETDSKYNIKLGPGGLMDIESIVQYLQLKDGGQAEGLRSTNTLTALKALEIQNIIDPVNSAILIEGFRFLRGLLSRVRLYSNYAIDYLETGSPHMPQIAKSLGFSNEGELIKNFIEYRNQIRRVYLVVVGEY